MEQLPKTLTIKSACAYADLGESTIYNLVRDGIVASATVGRRRLVFRDSLDRYLDSMRSDKFVAQPVPWSDPAGVLKPGGRYQPSSGRGRPRTGTR